MGRHIHLAPHLSVADLEQHYRAAYEPHERAVDLGAIRVSRGRLRKSPPGDGCTVH